MSERRSVPRKKVNLDVTIPVQLSGAQLFVRFIDLSSGGLRLSGDGSLPDEAECELRFPLHPFDEELAKRCPELTVRLSRAWQRSVYGGMWMAGFEFVELSAEQQQIVEELIARRTVDGALAAYRINRPMGVGLVFEEETYWFYPWVLQLSPRGLTFQTNETLIPGETVRLALKLVPGKVEVQLLARVESSSPVSDMRFRYDFAFHDADGAELEKLERFLREQVERELRTAH